MRVDVGDLSDLREGEMRGITAAERPVLVCRVGGQVHALEDRCSHAETTLSDGELEGFLVTCPLHFAQFDVRDGKHVGPPAWTGVPCYAVNEQPGATFVDLPTDEEQRETGAPPSRFQTR
jgi:3-phenylpropionate/trans-cinnamate dioxygenase ferredoxin subunit